MAESSVDVEARAALAERIRGAMEGDHVPGPTPETDDAAVRRIHARLLSGLDADAGDDVDEPWSGPERRDAERALLFLATDLPGPSSAWFERLPGGFPLGWLVLGGAFALGANAFGAPTPVVFLGVAAFGFAGVTLVGGALWVLALLWADRGRNPALESPDECWPFSDRRTYEATRDAL